MSPPDDSFRDPRPHGGAFSIEKGLQMQRFERDELSELISRAIACARDEVAALYAVPLDMGRMVDTAELAREAIREVWQALFRLDLQEPHDVLQRVIQIPQHRDG